MNMGRRMQPSAYSRRPRRQRRDARIATNDLEALAAVRQPIDMPTDLPVSSAVSQLRVIVGRLLEQTPGDALCDACLAFATEAALIDMRHATALLSSGRAGVERGTAQCVSCRRETVVTVFWTAAV